ncbi:MAG: thioredoxin fold domain-containing protein [Ferruginibacter sp.]|nr:thioredoxin fold domain-containing protein [Ferruginibacter sp.]
MKKLLFLLSFIFVAIIGFAQQDTSLIYLRFPTIPPFKLTKVPDSTVFTKDNLAKKKPTIIMVFSPDCEHCQEMTKQITANIKLFKKAQIVMATPLEFSYVKRFYNEYKIANYPTITMGRDPGYFLGTFYKVRSFPAIFIYNKKGNLVNWFSGEVELKKIVDSY